MLPRIAGIVSNRPQAVTSFLRLATSGRRNVGN